jgi:hypothetical protein
MKKYIFAAVILAVLGAGRAAAQPVYVGTTTWNFGGAKLPPTPATLTTIVKSTETYSAIGISSATPTNVILDTTQMFRWVRVQNFDTTAGVMCGENASAISTITESASGFEIEQASGNYVVPWMLFDIVPGSRFFCMSMSTVHAGRVGLSWGGR